MSYANDLVIRLRRSWIWVVLQFVLTLVLIVASYGWTRIGEKNWWQVLLTLLVPLLLALSLLELQAGTMCSLTDADGTVVGALDFARLVRRSHSIVGRLSQLARVGRRSRNLVHIQSPSTLVH